MAAISGRGLKSPSFFGKSVVKQGFHAFGAMILGAYSICGTMGTATFICNFILTE